MSTSRNKGEDIYAYTRILKYSNKRSGTSIKDFILVILTLIINISVDFYLNNFVEDKYSTIIFTIFLLFIFMLIIAFLDYATGLGLFKEKGVLGSSLILLFAISLSTVITLFASKVFNSGRNTETLSLISFGNLIFISVIISYFLMTSTPNRQGREQIIKNLTEIKEEIIKQSITDLNIKESLKRSLKWLQFQQSPDRIWGQEDPLYETSEILRSFLEIGKGLNHSWRDINKGEEDIHKLEQTYYLILDTLEKSKIEPQTTILSTLVTVGMINPENLSITSEKHFSSDKLIYINALSTLFKEFKEELNTTSEWDFINELEKFDDNFANRKLLPILFLFSRIFHLIDDKTTYYKCGEIFADTFAILINRSDSRFNKIEQKEISNYVLGLMYNTLTTLLKKVEIVGDGLEGIGNMEEEFDLPDLGEDNDLPGMALPGFDDFDFDDDVSLESHDKMRVDISLATVRNLIRKKQEIDGSWSGRIDTTAECLIAVMDRESSESDFIKIGIHYLLALQENNGSWQDDVLLTSQVVRALHKVQSSIGGFSV